MAERWRGDPVALATFALSAWIIAHRLHPGSPNYLTLYRVLQDFSESCMAIRAELLGIARPPLRS